MAKVKTKNSRQVAGNISLQVWYRKELLKHIRRMADKTEKELVKAWRQNTPKMTLEAEQAVTDSAQAMPSGMVKSTGSAERAAGAQCFPRKTQATASVQQDAVPSGMVYDASPAASLAKVLNSLQHYFRTHFQTLADRVSRKFASRAESGASVSLKSILKEEGFTVNFRLTRQMNDILQAVIAENVGLIKSIPSEYFSQIQTIVMQGVKNGRDLEYIKGELLKRYEITERRAQIIARDQTNKATQAISRARVMETGITTARWVHIPGAKTSRETHKAFDGQIFDIRKGMYDRDAGRYVQPGELINCNCRFRLVVPSIEK